ncbi:site-specific DNA-methyltransferase [Ignavibacteriales bacterium]
MMDQIDKFPLNSMDIKQEQIYRFKQLFPEVFTEGDKIDWEKLKTTLGENIEVGKERFGLNWAGKSQCFKLIQQPSTGTLIPAKEESMNFDATENLFIEGDNLEVLKLLQKAYFGKVKMIYIDPPYNTGNDFVYSDDFKDNLKNYLEITGQVDSEGRRLTTNVESNGRFHSNWLNMMYPRLFLARNLLSDDGVIFISIDDKEVHNLKSVCNEIFGEENVIGILPTIMNLKGNNDEFAFAGAHEFTLVALKNKDSAIVNGFNIDDDELEDWEEDEIGPYKRGANLRSSGANAPREKRPNLYFPIYIANDMSRLETYPFEDSVEVLPLSVGKQMSWRWSVAKVNREKKDIIIEKTNQSFTLYKKQRPAIGDMPSKKPKTIFYKPEYSSGNGTAQIKKLFNDKIFTNPKPIELLKDFIQIGISGADLILDFFAGSCTTAHSVLEMNSVDNKNRKFICIQLPEPTDETSEAFKLGYKNIAEIGKERIRRVISKIREEELKKDPGLFNEEYKPLDLGFKVFKLQPSNFSTWDPNVEKSVDALTEQLFRHVDHLSPEAAQDAILYELLLKAGFELTTEITKLTLAGKTVFSIMDITMLICLERALTDDLLKAIAELKPAQFICLDEGFRDNDQLKSNAVLLMKQNGVQKFQTV